VNREFERWIRQAIRNLESAKRDAGEGFYEWACFKAQQAAELAVRALLRAFGVLRGGHSVLKLLEVVAGELRVSVPREVLEAAAELDHYYIPPRYPDAYDEGSPYEYYTAEMANRAISHAEKVINWVLETWRALTSG